MRWTETEDQYLLSHFELNDLGAVAKILNRSEDSVRRRYYRVRPPVVPDEDYVPIELKWILERTNRTAPKKLRALPRGATSTAKASNWTGNKTAGNAYRNTKTGYRRDIGITVRSGWEANVCRVLKSYGIPYEYEPAIFSFPIKRGPNKAYKPDIYLPITNEWIEIKGYFDKNSQLKMKRFRKYYPDEWATLTMIINKNSKETKEFCAIYGVPNILFYQDINKIFRSRISNWE